MTKSETLELLTVLKVAYPQQLGKISDIEAAAMVELWADTFARVPKSVMQIAVKKIVKDSKFFPSIADMCEVLDQINRDADFRLTYGKYERNAISERYGERNYNEQTEENLEFIRASTADFAVTKFCESRSQGAKDFLLGCCENSQLLLPDENKGGGG